MMDETPPAESARTAETRGEQSGSRLPAGSVHEHEATTPPPPYVPDPEYVQSPPPPFAPYPAYPQLPPRRPGVPWYAWAIGGCLGLVALSVLILAIIFGLIAAIAINYAHQVPLTQQRTRTLSVSGTPTLSINDSAGTVMLQRGTTGRVTVQATKSARDTSRTRAQTDLGSISVSTTQQGNTITLAATADGSTSILGSDRHVDFVISVPPTANVTAQLDAGTLVMGDISGLMQLTVDAGDVQLAGATLADGSYVHVDVGNATVSCTLAPGASLDVRVATGNAEVRLPATTRASLTAATQIGHVTITGWAITPTSTSVTGQAAQGALGASPAGTVGIHVNTGNITLARA